MVSTAQVVHIKIRGEVTKHPLKPGRTAQERTLATGGTGSKAPRALGPINHGFCDAATTIR